MGLNTTSFTAVLWKVVDLLGIRYWESLIRAL
jgi:hypothetical protein